MELASSIQSLGQHFLRAAPFIISSLLAARVLKSRQMQRQKVKLISTAALQEFVTQTARDGTSSLYVIMDFDRTSESWQNKRAQE